MPWWQRRRARAASTAMPTAGHRHAFMARAGLPVTLLSGIGGKLGDVLISNPRIGALAFVGGRSNGRAAATSLADAAAATFSSRKG